MPAAERIRVIIADDHPVVRAGLRALLDVGDIEVVAEAGSGTAAVAEAAEHDPDVILMDVRMEDGDGLMATRAIREATPRSRVLVVTSFEDEDYLRSAVHAGASGFILKRASRTLLLDSIRTVHAGGSTFPFEMLEGIVAPQQPHVGAAPQGRGDGGLLTVAKLAVDPGRHLVLFEGRQIVLSYMEFRAVAALARAQGEIVSHEDLQRAVWPEGSHGGDPHRIVSLVARLRSRLGPARAYLQTVKRVGYRLAEPEIVAGGPDEDGNNRLDEVETALA
ncbi:MAG: response regulator [Dehalococcoidia bacterium]